MIELVHYFFLESFLAEIGHSAQILLWISSKISLQETLKIFKRTTQEFEQLTSLSEVPHSEQDLHSMHCHLYFFTSRINLSVNCRHDG